MNLIYSQIYPFAFRSSLGLCPWELLQAMGYIWLYIPPLVLIRIQCTFTQRFGPECPHCSSSRGGQNSPVQHLLSIKGDFWISRCLSLSTTTPPSFNYQLSGVRLESTNIKVQYIFSWLADVQHDRYSWKVLLSPLQNNEEIISHLLKGSWDSNIVDIHSSKQDILKYLSLWNQVTVWQKFGTSPVGISWDGKHMISTQSQLYCFSWHMKLFIPKIKKLSIHKTLHHQ